MSTLVVFVLLGLVVVLLPALRYSVTISKLEAACGLAVALVGCLGVAYALFGSLFENSAGQSGYVTLVQIAAVPIVFVVVGILSLGPIGVAEKSGKHAREHSRR